MSGRVAVVHEAPGPVAREVQMNAMSFCVTISWVQGKPITPVHRPTFGTMNETLSTITDRLSNMTEYMTRGNSPDEAGPFTDTPFEEYYDIRTWNDKEKLLQHAENALRHLKQVKSASDDDLRNAAIAGNDYQKLGDGYWSTVAPLIATAECVGWNGAFRLEADAPEHGSDEWKAAASALEIPETRSYDLVPKAVGASYRHLEKIRERNGYPRPASRFELKQNCGVHMTDRGYQKVWEFLRELPGVKPPAETPAWEVVATDPSGASDTTDAGEESHAD